MNHVQMSDAEDILSFVRRAALAFAENPNYRTYTDNAQLGIVCGALFAVRWGMGDDCVLVFRIGEDLEPTVYGQAIHAQDTNEVASLRRFISSYEEISTRKEVAAKKKVRSVRRKRTK